MNREEWTVLGFLFIVVVAGVMLGGWLDRRLSWTVQDAQPSS